MAAADADCNLLVCSGRYVATDEGDSGRLVRPSRFRRALVCGHTPFHQATLFGPAARRRLARYREDFKIAGDLDYFLRLSTWPHLRLRLRQLDLELLQMGDRSVSGQRH